MAVLVASPLSLTVCRIAAPLLVAGGLMALPATGTGPGPLALLGWGAVFVLLVFQASFGDRMVNGSAYGAERRMSLRPPAFALVGPIQVAWLAIAAGVAVPIWALLSQRYVVAAIAAVLGLGAGWAGGRILHQLARRWVVFVPAGFVVKDPMTLVDAVLFRRHTVASVGPALDDHAAATAETRTDLSGGARGLSIEVALTEPTIITLREGNQARGAEATNVVFTPSLPGAMLQESRIRGLKIGRAGLGS